MVGILPDCHIHFITFDIITFKANQLLKKLISQFFDDRSSLALDNEADLISLEFLYGSFTLKISYGFTSITSPLHMDTGSPCFSYLLGFVLSDHF